VISPLNLHLMFRPYLPLTAAALLGLTACAPDLPMASTSDTPASVALDLATPAQLTSLGDTVRVHARITSRTGTSLERASMRWSVEPAGIVTPVGIDTWEAVRNGRVTIIGSLDPASTGVRPSGYWAERTADTVVVDVRQRAVSLTLTPVDTLFNTVGATRTVRVSVRDARGHELMDAPPPTWLTANPNVITVDGTGVVQSAGAGDAQVTVQAGGLTGRVSFTVQPRLPHTSCMVYARRRESRQSCVTLGFVLREQTGRGQ
jgi:hypothetical protein